jgi:hypothetical protein
MAIFGVGQHLVHFEVTSTDLVAGTSQWVTAPIAGRIMEMEIVVQTAIVADVTPGALTVELAGTAVTGLSCAIADLAAAGTVVNDLTPNGSTTNLVAKGDDIEIVPVAIEADPTPSGMVRGWLRIVGVL